MPSMLLLFAVVLAAEPANAPTADWPAFRGAGDDGSAPNATPPLHWSESKSVLWKTPIPHEGWSSPLVAGDQVWITTATADGKEMFAVCVALSTGKVIRTVKVFDTPEPQPIFKNLNNFAAPTGAVEAGRVWVHFGTHGTACLDATTGEKLWERRDLQLDHKEGAGASLLPWRDFIIVECDGQDVQYVVALDKKTGKTVWKTPRSIDFGNLEIYHKKAYSTPIVRPVNGKPVLFCVAGHAAYAYDPTDGRELWRVRHPGWSNITRPIVFEGLVFVNTGFARPELWAIRTDGKGDVTGTHIAWKFNRGVSITASPALVDGLLYFVSDNGVLTCLDAKAGTAVWTQRLGGNFAASPFVADGRIWFLSLEGKMTVIKPGRTYEQVAVNELEGMFKASPAPVGKRLVLRSRTHLYCIGE